MGEFAFYVLDTFSSRAHLATRTQIRSKGTARAVVMHSTARLPQSDCGRHRLRADNCTDRCRARPVRRKRSYISWSTNPPAPICAQLRC